MIALTDQPVDGSSEKPDLFHRADFAERIAMALCKAPESGCLVASIEGSWGTGKTSVLDMIRRRYISLEDDEKPVVFRFNPWMFSGLGNLTKEFLVQFGATLDTKDEGEKLRKVGRELIRYSSVFDLLKFLPGSEPWSTVAKAVFQRSGEAAEAIGELKSLNAEGMRNKVVAALDDTKKTFIVIIDDIDRLVPDEIFAVFRLIKAVSNFPRVVFLLAYEHDHVQKALERVGVPDARSYIEKIVQLRIPLPRISVEDARRFLEQSLRGFGESPAEGDFQGERQRWSMIALNYILPLLNSPRDYIRLTNRLRLNYGLVEGELAFSDYCLLETLAVVEPKAYDHIKDNPIAYVGEDPMDILTSRQDVVDSNERQRELVLEEIPDENRRRIVRAAIGELFPATSTGGGNSSIPSRSSGRVSNPDNFEFAFHYSRPHNIVTLEDLRGIWRDVENRMAIFESLAEPEKTRRLLSLLDELLCPRHQHPGRQEWGLPENVPDFLRCYARYLELDGLPKEVGDGLLGFDYRTYISRALHWTFERMEENVRSEAAEQLCGDRGCLPFGAVLVSKNIQAMKGEDGDEEKLFADEAAEEFNRAWYELLALVIADRTVPASRFLGFIFRVAVNGGKSKMVGDLVTAEDLAYENLRNGLMALLSEGSINGRSFVCADTDYMLNGMDLKTIQATAKGLQAIAPEEFEGSTALYNAYEQPGKRFFLDSGEDASGW